VPASLFSRPRLRNKISSEELTGVASVPQRHSGPQPVAVPASSPARALACLRNDSARPRLTTQAGPAKREAPPQVSLKRSRSLYRWEARKLECHPRPSIGPWSDPLRAKVLGPLPAESQGTYCSIRAAGAWSGTVCGLPPAFLLWLLARSRSMILGRRGLKSS
jgi:hypothetical protein